MGALVVVVVVVVSAGSLLSYPLSGADAGLLEDLVRRRNQHTRDNDSDPNPASRQTPLLRTGLRI